MTNMRAVRAVVLLTLSCIFLAACGGGADDDAGSTDDVTEAAATTAAADPTEEEAPADTASEAPTDADAATEAPDDEETDAASTAGGEPEITELTVGAIPIADTAALHYAVNEGLFSDAGLDVTIATSQGGAEGVPALVSGDRHLDVGNLISLAQARAGGVDIVSFPYILEHPQDAVVLASAADSEFAGVEDLEDQQVTIAINTLGNLGEVLVRNAWEQAGLEWADVEVVQIPFPDMVPAMERGDVNLAWLPEPFLTIAKGSDANIVLDTVTQGPPIDGGLISGPVLATREFAEAHPNTIALFYDVLQQAGETLNEDRAAAEATMAEYTSLPPEVVANLALPTWAPDASEERVQAFLDLSAEYGITEPTDTADFYMTPGS